MKKSKKIALAVACILIAGGICISVGAMFVMDFKLEEISSVKPVSNSYNISENFSGISVDGAECDVLFAVSNDDTCNVVCDESDKVYHLVTVENDTLTIKRKDTRKWYEYIGFFWTKMKVTVYLPQSEYGALNVSIASGDAEIGGNLHFEEAKLSSASGDIIFSGTVQKSLSLKVASGNVKVSNSFSESLDAKSASGDIKISSFKATGDMHLKCASGDIEIVDAECLNMKAEAASGDIEFSRVVAVGHSAVETASGDIELSDCDSATLFLKSGSGDITGTLLTEKIFYTDTGSGKVRVPYSSDGGKCEIKTGSGNIEFSIK
ncbi:MAG: DUF4097 family beta strand repeat protein [Clostridia bacterium]|nr:DUF4097 family beta strand repeat protein [Clostridia bacterium]